MNVNQNRKLKVFTWHVHGTYLYYLSKGDFNLFIPVNGKNEEGYYGRGNTFPFGENVTEIPAEEVKYHQFDCILFQTSKNYLTDQFDILTDEQKKLPRVFVQHDPPWKHPVNEAHAVNDPEVVMVHVTHFNKLMWCNNNKVVTVIEHGVPPVNVTYTGELDRGIVVINHLHQRGRMLGADIFDKLKKELPLDLIGMGTKEYGGLGEILHPQLPAFISRYRFFFNPIRYTSFGLAVCEAMMTGMPVVSLATTEYSTVISDGINGFIHTDIDYLCERMKLLLNNRSLAQQLGTESRITAEQKFDIDRFTKQWRDVFHLAITRNHNYYEKANSIYQ
jgi:hypothetical protein